ncbi:hypothetical protein [Flavobacterium sp.]|uniref:hypothetical protein n=1 Tax=Flavobacterium sp. TaxID=239 RepID=UPI00391A56A2
MKNIYSCLIILTFFASCVNDENSGQEINPSISHKDGGDILPTFNANPYDKAGKIYDELFDGYYNGTSRSTDIQSVILQVEAIANANTSFNGIGQGHQPLVTERIEHLANLNKGDIASVIGASTLSPTAKTSFSNYLISISALFDSEEDASIMYNAIVKYEETVIDNELLTANDQRIILTTTSIMRYSSYRAKKKPKKNTDPYWNIWVTHVFGAEEGAEENLEKSIILGLVTFVVSNK